MESYHVNKFSLGELSPRFIGHPDNEIYYNGARKLKNAFVTEQQGAEIIPGTYYRRSTYLNEPARLGSYLYNGVAFTLLFAHERLEILEETITPIVMPYSEAELHEFDMAQYGNTLYIVHREHPIHTLVRSDLGVWTLDIPYIEPFHEKDDYPGAVTTFEGRLVFASTNNTPAGRWGSQAGAPETFSSMTDNDDDPWFAEGPHSIYWISGGIALFIGTEDGVYYSGGPDSILTPSNAFVEHSLSSYSVSQVRPVLAGSYLLVPQGFFSALRAVSYSNDSRGFLAPNIGLYSEHLFESGIRKLAFQRDPEPATWIVTNDGKLLLLRLNERDSLPAVTEIDTFGHCEDVVTTRAAGEDSVYFITRRFTDGAYRRQIDQLAAFDQGPEVADMHFFFSGVQWDGGPALPITAITNAYPCIITVPGHDFVEGEHVRIRRAQPDLYNGVYAVGPVTADNFQLRVVDDSDNINSIDWDPFDTTPPIAAVCERVTDMIDGLAHLDQEDLGALIDGESVEHISPLGGEAQLQNFGNRIHAGYPYKAYIQLMPLGVAPNRIKRVSRLFFRFINTVGARYGEVDDDGRVVVVETLPFRKFEDIMGDAIPLFSGMKDVEIQGDYLRNGAAFVESGGPLPFMVTNIMCELEVW